MENIIKFCENATQVYCGTSNLNCIKELSINMNLDKDEIYRSRWGNDNTCIFNMSLQLKGNETLQDEIQYMKTIEMFYPNMFSWRFNGKHIEVIAIMSHDKEYLGIFNRYKGIISFLLYLRKRLITILKFRDYSADFTSYKTVYDHILATGSVNGKTGCHAINILPTESFREIMERTNKNIGKDIVMKTLDMKFWVKEINPDFYKEFRNTPKMKKYKIEDATFDMYPPCIKQITKLPKKGNYNRYLLGTFFLGIHNERDAKHQLDVVLDDNERKHLNHGNCKDQWRAILVKGYSPPSCKTMIDAGFCDKDCGRAAPIDLEGGEK